LVCDALACGIFGTAATSVVFSVFALFVSVRQASPLRSIASIARARWWATATIAIFCVRSANPTFTLGDRLVK
jgi:hypothetical protein